MSESDREPTPREPTPLREAPCTNSACRRRLAAAELLEQGWKDAHAETVTLANEHREVRTFQAIAQQEAINTINSILEDHGLITSVGHKDTTDLRGYSSYRVTMKTPKDVLKNEEKFPRQLLVDALYGTLGIVYAYRNAAIALEMSVKDDRAAQKFIESQPQGLIGTLRLAVETVYTEIENLQQQAAKAAAESAAAETTKKEG